MQINQQIYVISAGSVLTWQFSEEGEHLFLQAFKRGYFFMLVK